eukprot:GFKZ01000310.1.p1 GENE.GFKZ01000310.1~~GFKZ01000310.1.p1  ORF type:complete len:177 (+),score=12.47 GFKZ01000310.1:149-679(+)
MKRKATKRPYLIPSRHRLWERPPLGQSLAHKDQKKDFGLKARFHIPQAMMHPASLHNASAWHGLQKRQHLVEGEEALAQRGCLRVRGVGVKPNRFVVASDVFTVAAFRAVISILSSPADTCPLSEFPSPPLAATSSLHLSADLKRSKDTEDTSSQRRQVGNAPNTARSAMEHYKSN